MYSSRPAGPKNIWGISQIKDEKDMDAQNFARIGWRVHEWRVYTSFFFFKIDLKQRNIFLK